MIHWQVLRVDFLMIEDVEEKFQDQVGRERAGVQERHQLTVQTVHVVLRERSATTASLVHHLSILSV